MQSRTSNSIGESLYNFQAALSQNGESLDSFINRHYVNKWLGDNLFHAIAIRTTFVDAIQHYLTDQGLFNMERVSLSPVTDPLAHDVEHTPAIHYKGHTYLTTHSMIYSKFLACFNPKIKGVFVDSPNIRLEIESPNGEQRGRYLIDFSQIDIELRRNRHVQLQQYFDDRDRVIKILREDFERALSFFEEMIIHSITSVVDKNEADLKALEIVLEVPRAPFPRMRKDEVVRIYGAAAIERQLGRDIKAHFFWVTGLMRENYDLIYPYLNRDGKKKSLATFTSDMIYNYDLCAQSLKRNDGSYGTAYEVLSGGIREWLYEPIVERLIDNKVLPVKPIIDDGNIENINELGGYGPFLLAVSQKDENGISLFPDTFGGGIGVERTLLALLNGETIKTVDELTFFGKNPDSFPLYLF